MTLVLTLVTDKLVVQASDRRLTWPDGGIKDDEANKAIIVYCRDGRFAIAYTGLAEIGGKRTDHWLHDTLVAIDAGKLDFLTVEHKIAAAVRIALSESRFAMSSRQLTIVFAGYEVRSAGLSGNKVCRRFVRHLCIPDGVSKIVYQDKDQLILAHGCLSAVSLDLSRRVRKLAKRKFFLNRSDSSIARELVSFIRLACTTPSGKKWIGQSCMSVSLKASEGLIGADYYPLHAVTEAYMPHFVFSKGISGSNVRFGPLTNGALESEPSL